MQQTNVVDERSAPRGEEEETSSLVCAAFHASPDGLAITSDGRLRAWNREFAALWRTPSEIREGASMLRHVRAQLADGEAFVPRAETSLQTITRTMRCCDGRVIESTARALPGGRLWCFRDVTQRERVERELRESEARYRALYKKTPVMMQSIDAEGRILSVSEAWQAALGYERSEVIGRQSVDFLTPESRARALESDLPALWRTGSATDLEHQLVTKAGEVRDVLISATAERTPNGTVERALAVLIDVTERKRIEAERDRLLIDERVARTDAEEALGRLDALLRSAPVVMAFFDREMRFVRVSDALAALHGAAPGTEAGQSLQSRVPDAAAAVEPCLRHVLETGEPLSSVPIDAELPGRPGERLSFLVSYYPVRNARRELLGVGAVAIEVTEQKRAVELQARLFRDAQTALRARDDFLAAVSHELRTPMTPLELYLQTIQSQLRAGRPVDPEHVDRALRQLFKLAALVDDLLDSSLVGLSQLELHRERASLPTIVRDVVTATRATSGREIDLEISGPELVVSGDRLRLAQAISTLIDNAIKYSPAGAPVRVVLELAAEGASLAILDRGIGIPADELPHLFERFFRGRNAPITNYGGLGLGLYICRDIIARHGGRIWAENRAGGGAVFHVVLPLALSEEVPS